MKNKILSILFLVNILSEQVSHSQQVQFNYDNNQKLKQALSSQNDKKFSYDPNGNRISHYQIGEVTTYIFNGNGAWSDTAKLA